MIKLLKYTNKNGFIPPCTLHPCTALAWGFRAWHAGHHLLQLEDEHDQPPSDLILGKIASNSIGVIMEKGRGEMKAKKVPPH